MRTSRLHDQLRLDQQCLLYMGSYYGVLGCDKHAEQIRGLSSIRHRHTFCSAGSRSYYRKRCDDFATEEVKELIEQKQDFAILRTFRTIHTLLWIACHLVLAVSAILNLVKHLLWWDHL